MGYPLPLVGRRNPDPNWGSEEVVEPMLRPNGTRFGGWLLNTGDNRFGPVGDFDGDGADELLVTSGTRFGGWLLNTADNRL